MAGAGVAAGGGVAHVVRLEDEGVIGELAPNVFSCMGGVYSQRRVNEELLPELLANFRAQEIDAAFLVPM